MKRFIRCIALCLVMSVLLVTPAFAAESNNLRSSDFFLKSSVYLSTVSGNTFKVTFNVTATDIMDELGASMIIVQRRASSSDSWQNVKTYYPSSYAQMIDYDQVTHAASVTYYGTSGYQYRAYVELYAKNSAGNVGYMPEYAYF